MGYKYILDGKNPIPADTMTWTRWMNDRRTDIHVADEKVGEVRISTVFLGLDHNFDKGDPILFETLVFGGPLDGEMDRYHTWEEAEAGHAAIVQRVLNAAMKT